MSNNLYVSGSVNSALNEVNLVRQSLRDLPRATVAHQGKAFLGIFWGELLHEKVFVITFLISLGLITLSFILGALSFSEQERILVDFSLLGIFISSAIMSTFSGSYLISKEMEKQTLLLALVRPLSRTQFLLSKLLSVIFFIFVQIFLWIFLLGFLLKADGVLWLQLSQIALTIFLQSVFFLVFSGVMSLLVRPALAFFLTMSVGLLGFWIDDLIFLTQKNQQPLFHALSAIAKYIVPRLDRTNWKTHFYYLNGIPFQDFFWMLLHLGGWIVFWTSCMMILFRRRDLA